MQGCHQGMAILSSHHGALQVPPEEPGIQLHWGPCCGRAWLCAPRRAGGERQAVQRLLSNYQQENLRLHQAA